MEGVRKRQEVGDKHRERAEMVNKGERVTERKERGIVEKWRHIKEIEKREQEKGKKRMAEACLVGMENRAQKEKEKEVGDIIDKWRKETTKKIKRKNGRLNV